MPTEPIPLLGQLSVLEEDLGSTWEVHCGYVDHLISEERYADAFEELSGSGETTAMWVLYQGIQHAQKLRSAKELKKYADFVQFCLANG